MECFLLSTIWIWGLLRRPTFPGLGQSSSLVAYFVSWCQYKVKNDIEGEISGVNPQLLFGFLMSKSVFVLICGYNHTNLLCLFSNQSYLVSTLSYSHRYTAQTLLQRITFSWTPSPVPCCLSSVIKLLAKHYSIRGSRRYSMKVGGGGDEMITVCVST